jgi:hypothetical protein
MPSKLSHIIYIIQIKDKYFLYPFISSSVKITALSDKQLPTSNYMSLDNKNRQISQILISPLTLLGYAGLHTYIHANLDYIP